MSPCNNSSKEDDPYTKFGPFILSLFGIPGNALVIILTLRAKQKKSTTTYLLLNLASADFANLLAVIAVAVAVFFFERHRLHWLLTIPPKIVANFTLTVIAFERYNALVKTMESFVNITKIKIVIGVTISWLIGLAFSTLAFLHKSHLNSCVSPHWHIHLLWGSILFLGYILPFFTVLFCYSSIVKGLYLDRTILGQKATNEASLNEKKRLIRILVMITLVFLACNVPTIIILAMRHHYFRHGEKRVLGRLVRILGCLSSSLNPYIYGLQSEKYRAQVKQLFCKKQGGETTTNAFGTKL